ncbi:MAG: hypothetical protein DMG32_03980 [Acidobacteria bacterium]|nr:MAG: hypothetical protein DMG32_03980 [Acidobacteriota bacterium]
MAKPLREGASEPNDPTEPPLAADAASLPTTLPGTSASVLYILNPANGETVAPWNGSSSTTYPDDEICKETTTIGCSSNLPSLSSCNIWCVSATASTTYAASPVLPWKWVRLMLK